MSEPSLTRRDRCYEVSIQAAQLTPEQAERAWRILSNHLDAFGERDLPKFNDLLEAISTSINAATDKGMGPSFYQRTTP